MRVIVLLSIIVGIFALAREWDRVWYVPQRRTKDGADQGTTNPGQRPQKLHSGNGRIRRTHS